MKKKHTIFLLLIGIPFLVYFKSLNNDFVQFDDDLQVYNNALIKTINFENVKRIMTTPVLGMYAPLTLFSYASIANFFGVKSATPFHIFSFVLHVLNLLFVYFLGLKILKNQTKAVLLSLLFSLHPLAVEAVSWVSATSTLLFSAFFLSGMYYYIRFLESNQRSYYVITLLLFVLGCFSKVQMIPFVGVLFLLDFLYKKPWVTKKNIFQKLPFLIFAFIFIAIALQFREDEKVINATNYGAFYFSLNQITWYITKLLAPFSIGISYIWPKELTFIHHLFVVFILPLIYLVYRFRKNQIFIFGVLFFLANIVLHTAFFSVTVSAYSARYTYLSGIGIWIVFLAINFQKNIQYTFYIALVVFAFLTNKQTDVWKNSKALYEHAIQFDTTDIIYYNLGTFYVYTEPKKAQKYFLKSVQYNPNFYRGYYNLGAMIMSTNPKKAEKYFLKTVEIKPDHTKALNQLGVLCMKSDIEKATNYFLKAIQSNAIYDLSYVNLGILNMKLDVKKAEEYFLKAIQINPKNSDAHNNLGVLYMKSSLDKSKKYFLKAIKFNPNKYDYYLNLGIIYLKLSDKDTAKKYFLKTLKLSPNNKKALNLLKKVNL